MLQLAFSIDGSCTAVVTGSMAEDVLFVSWMEMPVKTRTGRTSAK